MKTKLSVEDMIATYTPEEWLEIIEKEMEKLGLEFSPDYEYEKESLFNEEDISE